MIMEIVILLHWRKLIPSIMCKGSWAWWNFVHWKFSFMQLKFFLPVIILHTNHYACSYTCACMHICMIPSQILVQINLPAGCIPPRWPGGHRMATDHNRIWYWNQPRIFSYTSTSYTSRFTNQLLLVDGDTGHALHAGHGSGPGRHWQQ